MRSPRLLFVGLLSSMLLMPVTASADNTLRLEPLEISAGETKELTISLDNDMDITLVQFDLKLPQGLSIPVNSKNRFRVAITDRTTLEDHSINVNAIDGVYRILLASMTNTVIEGNDGALFKVTLTADETFSGGTISLEKIELVSPDEIAIHPISVSIDVQTSSAIHDITTPPHPKGQSTYDLGGRKVSRAWQRGIIIVDGRKVSYSRKNKLLDKNENH